MPRHTRRVAAAAGLALYLGGVGAHAGAQGQVLLPDDGAPDAEFGWSVAATAARILVGAPGQADNGPGAGAAYVFSATSGSQLLKLLPDDGTQNDSFGRAVALDGATAVVGAWWDDDAGSASGSAYVFDAATGAQLQKLVATDGGIDDELGAAVDVQGTLVVAGADGDDDLGANAGAAYLFDASTGQQLFKLLADDGQAGDRFGTSVAIDGGLVLVGANLASTPGGASGAAYLFDASTGVQVGKLVPGDGASNDWFGYSVALEGTLALVGAPNDDDNGFNSGAAYAFETTTGQELAKLVPAGSDSVDGVGWSVALRDGTAVLGADGDGMQGPNAGAAYVYASGTWVLVQKLVMPDGAAGDRFGASVATAAGLVVAGAPAADDQGSRSGRAYLVGPPAAVPALGLAGAVSVALLVALGGAGLLRRRGGVSDGA